ncbi:uncharacterized protein IL334_002645 [Kwoniella shivajii]|uniref:Methyltransferase domain-containing protein n=1 Tax=Kwoniella shivajii TaxID=564305 RepID=A0ABZ1CWL6_9TREE|nr:hypothetical protein IL334_002645 [Kwoniella shivajii]
MPLFTVNSHTPSSTASLTEKDRLNALHALHMAALEPHHSNVIDSHLHSIHAIHRRSSILDVGTGTGMWAIQMANVHPFADVLAVDVDWSLWSNNHARNGNVDFAAIDVTEPLPWPRGIFDVIHVKGFLLEVPNYSRLIEKLAVALRPGGLMIIVEAEPGYISANYEFLPECLRKWNACVQSAYANQNIDVHFPSKIASSIAASGVFRPTANHQNYRLPVESYARGDIFTLAKAGQIHPQVLTAEMRKMLIRLLEYGYDQHELESLLQDCILEMLNPNSNYTQNLFAVYATKNY